MCETNSPLNLCLDIIMVKGRSLVDTWRTATHCPYIKNILYVQAWGQGVSGSKEQCKNILLLAITVAAIFSYFCLVFRGVLSGSPGRTHPTYSVSFLFRSHSFLKK